MKYIGVFCSANEIDPRYTQPAEDFAHLMALDGYNLVWGGSNTGLMKRIANKVQEHGGNLIGVTIEIFKHVARENADEMIIAESLGNRKAIMLEKSDAIMALVGGIGTLDELTDIIELKKQNKHNKPIVILNTENFYTGLKTQLQKMEKDGFINRPLDEFIYFANTPEDALTYLNSSLK